MCGEKGESGSQSWGFVHVGVPEAAVSLAASAQGGLRPESLFRQGNAGERAGSGSGLGSLPGSVTGQSPASAWGPKG